MAEARAQMNKQYGNMITYHDEYRGTDGPGMRATNTFRSNITFGAPESINE